MNAPPLSYVFIFTYISDNPISSSVGLTHMEITHYVDEGSNRSPIGDLYLIFLANEFVIIDGLWIPCDHYSQFHLCNYRYGVGIHSKPRCG
jgi:hypothetical protein